MNSGFKIGRIFGIQIKIDWSWLFILLLITWNLSTVFGQYHPDWGIATNWGVGLLAALLFFASVLAHELAHSLVARSQGIPVRSITLFLFGGVSNIQRDPDSPQSELAITIVGPLTSIVLGVVLTLVAGWMIGPAQINLGEPGALISEQGVVTTILIWLGPINILIGLFNLVPGFPLDGGRILRSVFWLATDNLHKATRWATWVGQAVAWAMIITGIAMIFGVQIPFLGGGLLNGLWLAFIGWFLNSASASSYERMVVRDILEDIEVSRVMRKDPPTVSGEWSVDYLVHDFMLGSDEHAFPVVQEGQLKGIVTLEDVRVVPREKWEQVTVAEIMTPRAELLTIGPDDAVADALDELRRKDIRQLPVTSGKELIGLIRRRDILRWLQLQTDVRQIG